MCPSTHCERTQECRAPHDCSGTGKRLIICDRCGGYRLPEWIDCTNCSKIIGNQRMTLPKQIPPAARVIASTTLLLAALLAYKWCVA